MAVFFDDKIYIIELKCNQDANKAIRQMVEKRYADRYKEDEKRIILIGINFDTNKRAVTDWKKQRLDR
ncbi:MAG: PD-(D/E)XK nuclease domain-containing protein [Spirochaetales bacterium]|nr:PD-(D/E)XK nuclease domain-containing protein [Spirochaetales bacterium]